MMTKGGARLQLEALFSDPDIDEQEKPDSRTEQVVALDDNSSTERVAETEGHLPRTESAPRELLPTASLKVLIVHPDPSSTRALENIFAECGSQTWRASNLPEVHTALEQVNPELVVVDLHLPDDDWPQVLHCVTRNSPASKTMVTFAYPDPQRELEAREQGVQVFVRKPFTRARLDQATSEVFGLSATGELASEDATFQATLPKVRVPVRVKITIPYAILALLLAMAASYLVSRIVFESLDTRFTNQLIEMGKLVADRMAQEENQLLDGLRLVANMQQVPEAVSAGDAESLRGMVLPIAVNYGQEAIEVLDEQGTSVLSLRHRVGGDPEDYVADRGTDVFAQWGFVQKVLSRQIDQRGDKYAGVARSPWGDYLYVAGPVLDQGNQLVGVVLVGESLPTLVRRIRQDTLAHTTLYAFDGQPIASTLLLEGDVVLSSDHVLDILTDQDSDSLVRDRTVASIDYSEILGPWEVRRGEDLGVVGVSLPKAVFVRPSQVTRWQVFGIVTLAFFAVIALGVYVADRITRPLLRVVQASGQVAQGNLDIRVEPEGNDEVAVLAHSFNRMVSGLREGSVYRDLLGRTVSPVVREQLRQTFASGDLRLEGQSAVTTVLVSDIRGFTMLSEQTDPTLLLAWLNEYFAELVPIINAHGGVVNAFNGDAILAFFGILPRLLKPQESAYRACLAAREMLQAIERINARRVLRGEPPLVTGIGVNTGTVTAGGLGSADRVHYTIIGDTVNTTSRLQEITRQIGQTSAVLGEDTWSALGERCDEFYLESLGARTLRGKRESLWVYRLWPVVEAREE